MKIIILLLFSYFFCFTSLYAQNNTTNLDSLNATLETLSWKELDSIGKKFRNNYKFDISEIYFQKALQVAHEKNGKDSLYLISCKELGILFTYQGNYTKGAFFFTEGKKIAEKILGKEHSRYSDACHNLALLYYYQGLYQKAEPLFIEAKEILGKEHPNYASSCNNLANVYYYQGLYQKAESQYIEAKDIREKILGKEHPDYAGSCGNLANLYSYQGLYQKAEPLYIEAKKIKEKVLGKEHLEYATACNNLATLYIEEGLYQKALPLCIEAKNIREKVLGKEHTLYAQSCGNLADLYSAQGLFQKAEPLLIEAKSIREKTLGKEHPFYAISCSNLANLYSAQGLFQKAEPLYIETKNIREKALGERHIEYTASCNDLAGLYARQGLYQKADPLYIEAVENKKEQTKTIFPTLSEKEKQDYFSNSEFYFEDFTDFATHYYSQNKQISQTLFNQHLFTKGIIFSSTQKMKEQISNSNDTTLINQYEEWKKQKEEYISLIQKPISERDSSINLKEIASQINELEREISKKSESFKENTNKKEYTWQDVKQTLSKTEAAIEIIRLVRLNNQKKPIDTIYVALIITNKTKESPELFVLKNGNEMEHGALYFYQNNIEFKLEDDESYNQYWKPIQDKLDNLSKKGYSKIYFSHDGIYHKINLNTLRNPKTGKFLVEEQNIQLITSSRDLIERKEKGVENIDLSKNFEKYQAFLLGYPSYNLNGKDMLKVNGENRILNGLQRIIGEYTVVPVLEGTKIETNQINDLLTKKGISTTLLQNDEATEKNIKALKSPTILHFATHGFFINEISEGKVNTLQEAENRNLLKNPFLRSGVLLAGCQNPQVGQEDGILSAEEAMNLNLEGTELVVLSACETGLGDIQNGEGVYGLQRAFRQAGAKTLIMSLWKVSDEATQLLMVTFYENLLSGKSKREAFKIAQLKLKEKYSEPYYWGAFVMVGE